MEMWNIPNWPVSRALLKLARAWLYCGLLILDKMCSAVASPGGSKAARRDTVAGSFNKDEILVRSAQRTTEN